jgi:Holliday junction resolvase RusA-like endonuclease
MEPITLKILGDPQAQKRHRSVRLGSFNRQYDPSASDKGDFLSVVQRQAPDKPIDFPIEVHINVFFGRPKSHFKTGKNSHEMKESAPYWHTARPDFDNLAKFVCDALNKVYWKDDSFIVKCTVQKIYSEMPRTEITINKI